MGENERLPPFICSSLDGLGTRLIQTVRLCSQVASMHISRFGARGLRVRSLETRLMLSVSPTPVENPPALSFPLSEITTSMGGTAFSSQSTSSPTDNAATQASLPAIPFDDSLSPLTDVPDLDGDIRVPGDANDDGTIDFLDFLLMRENYGNENATWAQGDFSGDGRVSFEDLLLLSSRY